MKLSGFKSKPNKDKTIIGDEWNHENKPDYICSWCQRNLSKLIDSGGQNPCYYCNYCQISFEPSETQIRKKSKLGTQREEVEPEVTSIQTDPSKEVEIRHTPPIRGGFAELQKKGLRIKGYRTTEKE
jgi:DNA-directed RNA polymerase subunit RPC12/RpoP